MTRKSLLQACASAAVLSFAFANVASAEEEATQVGEVVVTGTSIRGVAAVGSPSTRIDVESIKASGAVQASDVARLLPQVLNFGADETRSSFNPGAQDGAANATAVRSVNLRGIGPEATLLLVNGRRVAPSGVIKAISDIDSVPTAAISRVEVVADGASAIYGSDAVAGVVNLITKHNFDGAETLARYGYADGLDQFVFSQTFGKTWNGGSAFIAYEKNKRTNLSGADRGFASQNRTERAAAQCAAASVTCDARPFTAAPGNIVISGVRYAIPAGSTGVGINPTAIVVGANRYDEGAAADLLPAQNRDSVLINAQQQIGEKLDVWYEGFWTRRWFDLAAPPALFTTTVGASSSLPLPSTNPWFVQPSVVGPQAYEAVEYRFLDDADPNSNGYERNQQHAAGFGYNITKDWRLSGYVSYNWDHGLQRRQSVLNNTILKAALLSSNAATAFNPFGSGGFNRANNAALVELIDGERYQYATSKATDYQLKADGPVGQAPGGPIKLAVGADFHDNVFNQALYATNTSSDGSVTTKLVNNKRQITAAFAELFVPLVGEANAMPYVKRLDISLADRHEKYSDFGMTNNPKFAVVYGPTEDFNIRATYGTSFRAPSLVDSADQIKNIFIQNLTNAGGGTLRGIFYNGGNSGLGPEKAKTYTAGFDWTPKAVSGLRIGATYYKITYTDRIDVVPNTALTNSVYAPFVIKRPTVGVADATFDALVAGFMASPDLQNPAEATININAIIDGRRQNLGSLNQDGVDLDVLYDFTNGYGDWTLGLNISKILHLTRVTAPGSAETDVLDTFGNPVDMRARGQIGWRRGAWSANAFVNYTDEYKNTAAGNTTVPDYTTVDASVSYRFSGPGVMKDLRVTVAGQNLLDRDPPVVLNGTLSWDSQAASPLGRYLSVELSKRW